MKKILIIFFIFSFHAGLFAGEKEVVDLAKKFYLKGEYYSAITELLRYQCLYPIGSFYPESMLLMARAYYRGDNIKLSVETLLSCHKKFPDKNEGEEALYMTGYVKLSSEKTTAARKTFDIYMSKYKKGRFSEEIERSLCFASALDLDFKGSRDRIINYRNKYPGGKFIEEVDELDKLIVEERNRPQKRLWLAVVGSMLFPGFGHFYTGHYALGILTFITNALLAYMIYDSYISDNMYQLVFFSLAELAFYQFSIFSAVREVREYNSRGNFYRKIKLGLSTTF